MEAVFDLSLPTSWAELNYKQLLMVYDLFSRDLSAAEVKTLCLCKWNRMKVLASMPDKRFIVKIKGEQVLSLTARQLQQVSPCLDLLIT